MWFKRLFNPIEKIGVNTLQDPTVDTQSKESSSVILGQKLQSFIDKVDVDILMENPVLRRFLLAVHWGDITQLFDAIVQQRKDFSGLTGVNIYSYFKPAGTPASVCLKRLVYTLKQNPSVPHTATIDIEQLIAQLQEASEIGESTLKELP